MLKKIVKYGNSCALVLDKALLELLNMAEGSVVKIKTDGVSLIITPQQALVQEAISPTLTVEDTMCLVSRKAIEQNLGSAEKERAFREEHQKIGDRFLAIRKEKLETPEARKAIEAVQKRFANDLNNPECIKQIEEIHQQYAPGLECVGQEINALMKKYAPATPGLDAATLNPSTAEFGKIHRKYRHILQQIVELNKDPEYIHEVMLLAEKHQLDKEPIHLQEYSESLTQLISKNVPEYAVYQRELMDLGKRLTKQIEGKKAPAKTGGRKKQ